MPIHADLIEPQNCPSEWQYSPNARGSVGAKLGTHEEYGLAVFHMWYYKT